MAPIAYIGPSAPMATRGTMYRGPSPRRLPLLRESLERRLAQRPISGSHPDDYSENCLRWALVPTSRVSEEHALGPRLDDYPFSRSLLKDESLPNGLQWVLTLTAKPTRRLLKDGSLPYSSYSLYRALVLKATREYLIACRQPDS